MAGAVTSDTDLDLIPRAVRDKLDRTRIKLHLKEWQGLSLTERQRLVDLTCDTPETTAEWVNLVDTLVLRATGRHAERLPGR